MTRAARTDWEGFEGRDSGAGRSRRSWRFPPIADEWAADKSPNWRTWWCTERRSELRAAGIAVVAATHDDEFVSIADLVVTLRGGRLSV